MKFKRAFAPVTIEIQTEAELNNLVHALRDAKEALWRDRNKWAYDLQDATISRVVM